VAVSTLEDKRGRPRGRLFLLHDTESKEMEERLRRSEEQLRQSQKLEAIGRLAGGIAHDFNNLLTVINGYSEMVEEELDADAPLKGKIGEIAQAARRAASLTSQLLAFSRKQVMRPELIDLNGLVDGMRGMLARAIGEDIELMTILHPDTGHIRADPGQIEQVIMNLVANARDAMPSGGRLTIETSREIREEARAGEPPEMPHGDYAKISVSDTGIGMDAGTLSRIFEPFFTTKEVGKGSGLGLPTVYGIIKQSDGTIHCASSPGKGTTFSIYIPHVHVETAHAPAPARETAVPEGKETILLVEDDTSVRGYTRTLLSKGGYAVLDVPGGAEALEVLARKECAVDLMLTDIIMPHMNGRELAQKVKETCPDIKLLYFSGYTDDAMIHHGISNNGMNFIQKPFRPADLLAKVRQV
jgi:two-component system, cell cycle sensor histidine kinase and response regulator CckA